MEVKRLEKDYYLEQLYTGCLAEAAYYIESNGEVAIIDPMRETAPYMEMAKERGARIKYVFETHFHADFVSGHVDLARKTGASIIYGPGAETHYDSIVAHDGQEFKLGTLTIRVLHTPGHTPESSCYLLLDSSGKERAVFTGDTLFIGEVGRPDLAVKTDLTREDLAKMLYHSLKTKLMALPDHVAVYPAHGAGSACGKNISQERFSTIGIQKKSNYALQPMSETEFVAQVTDGIMPAPQYFAKAAALNKKGYEDIDRLLEERTYPLEVSDVLHAIQQGAIILDTRDAFSFGDGHIPGSIFIGLDGSFASWVGTLIEDMKQPIVVLTEAGREREAILRLARVGYNNALGYLNGGIKAWSQAGQDLDQVESISGKELEEKINESAVSVVDVRKPGEYEVNHVNEAILYPLDFINAHLHELDKDAIHYVHCRSGYRSMVAISILKHHGYKNLINIKGGMKDIEQTSIPRFISPCQL